MRGKLAIDYIRKYVMGYRVPENIERILSKYPVLCKMRNMVLNRVCPICGRRFKTLHTLRTHLSIGRCGEFLNMVFHYILQRMIENEIKQKHRITASDELAKLFNEYMKEVIVS